MTRSRVLQIWFAVVALTAVAGMAMGVTVTLATVALLLAMCLVPTAVILMLWPADNASTLAQSIDEGKSR